MSIYEGGENWRIAADGAAVTPASKDDGYWQMQLEGQYALEVAPLRQAVWTRALACLAMYGGERCFKNGPLGRREDPALSTGLLLLGEPIEHEDGLRMNAVRLSTAETDVRARQLPLRAIKRATKQQTDEATARAADALDKVSGLDTLRLDALVLATHKELLINRHAMRGRVREAIMPFSYRGRFPFGDDSPFMKDAFMRSVLWSRPEVALWCNPLEAFDGRNHAYIHRPAMPDLHPPREQSLKGWQQAVASALRQAQEQQPFTETMLDMLMHVTSPVRTVLGKRAVVSLTDGDPPRG